jgi:hypothetical protein
MGSICVSDDGADVGRTQPFTSRNMVKGQVAIDANPNIAILGSKVGHVTRTEVACASGDIRSTVTCPYTCPRRVTGTYFKRGEYLATPGIWIPSWRTRTDSRLGSHTITPPTRGALPAEQSLTETARAQHRRGFCTCCVASGLPVPPQTLHSMVDKPFF